MTGNYDYLAKDVPAAASWRYVAAAVAEHRKQING